MRSEIMRDFSVITPHTDRAPVLGSAECAPSWPPSAQLSPDCCVSGERDSRALPGHQHGRYQDCQHLQTCHQAGGQGEREGKRRTKTGSEAECEVCEGRSVRRPCDGPHLWSADLDTCEGELFWYDNIRQTRWYTESSPDWSVVTSQQSALSRASLFGHI